MSDSSGYGTGGVSPIITVGATSGKSSCNTTNPSKRNPQDIAEFNTYTSILKA